MVPWRSPILGRSSAGHPKNLDSRKQYRGVNVFLLAFTAYAKGYGSSYWATYKQVQELGGNVRKGEKLAMLAFWKEFETTDRQTGDPKKVPVLRYGREALVAEMASAFLCAHAGINPPVIENQAAYIQGWIKNIKGEKKLVIAAASAGQKAADWIRGERGQAAP